MKMEFSDRQAKIISIVKDQEPISGEEIAKKIGVARATLRNDLGVLTMVGILDAKPKVGYFYAGQMSQPLLFEKIFNTSVGELMGSPMIVKHDLSIYDGVVTLFMHDIGSLYVVNEAGELAGVVSRKDLLRATVNNVQLNTTPVAVIMTRSPNIITIKRNARILDAGHLLLQHKIDSLPVISETNEHQVVGKISKTTVMEYFIKSGIDIENNSN